jgi:hypothetical protein
MQWLVHAIVDRLLDPLALHRSRLTADAALAAMDRRRLPQCTSVTVPLSTEYTNPRTASR